MPLQPENYYWISSPKIWCRLCYHQFQSESAVTPLFTLNIFFFPCPKLDILLQIQQNHFQGITQFFFWKYWWMQALTIVTSFVCRKVLMFGLGTRPVLSDFLLPESEQRPQLLLCVRWVCFRIIPCHVVILNALLWEAFITLFSYYQLFHSNNTSTMLHPTFSANATHYCENKQSIILNKSGLFLAPPNKWYGNGMVMIW